MHVSRQEDLVAGCSNQMRGYLQMRATDSDGTEESRTNLKPKDTQ